jgi:hypothetical protein
MHAVEECFDEDKWAERGEVVLVAEDGTFATYPCRADADDFLCVLDCHRAVSRVRNAMRAER